MLIILMCIIPELVLNIKQHIPGCAQQKQLSLTQTFELKCLLFTLSMIKYI